MSPAPSELRRTVQKKSETLYRQQLFDQFMVIVPLFKKHNGGIFAYLVDVPVNQPPGTNISIHPVLVNNESYFALGDTSFSQKFPAKINNFSGGANRISVNWTPTNQMPEITYDKVTAFEDFMQSPEKNVFYERFEPHMFFRFDVKFSLLSRFIQGLKTAGGLP